MRRQLIILVLICILLSTMLLGCKNSSDSTTSIPEAFNKELNIAVITVTVDTADYAKMFINAIKQSSSDFGINVQVYDANWDDNKYKELLQKAIETKPDGIILNLGNPSLINEDIQKASNLGIPVVTNNCSIDPAIKNVVRFGADNQKFTEMLMENVALDINQEGKAIYVWAPGSTPQEEKRTAYLSFIKQHPQIIELENFGSRTENTVLDTQTKMKELLAKYPQEGDITFVIASFDEFAKGCSQAIVEAGRNEIKVYGMDISDADIVMLKDRNNPWVATVAHSPIDAGNIVTRLLAKKIAGESTSDTYLISPILITKEMLPPDKEITMDNIEKYIPGFGNSKDLLTPWMEELAKKSRSK